MGKRLIIHAGFAKTASSAIQLFFSQHAAAFRESGVDYPEADPAAKSGSGNLSQILIREGFVARYQKTHEDDGRTRSYRQAGAARITDRNYWNTVGRIVSSSTLPVVLASGEFVGNQSSKQLRFMQDELLSQHEVHIIGFVRDPFDFAYSAWKQHVKTNRQRQPFDEYIQSLLSERKDLGMFRCFANLSSLGVRLSILNYDTFKDALLPAFFQEAEIDIVGSKQLQRDNRSLTDSEAQVLQKVNRAFADRNLPRIVAGLMLKRTDPTAAGGRYYSSSIHGMILKRYADDIRRLNEVIIGGALSTTVRSTPDAPLQVDGDDIDLLLAATRLGLRRQEAQGSGGRFKQLVSRVRRVIGSSGTPRR